MGLGFSNPEVLDLKCEMYWGLSKRDLWTFKTEQK